MLLLALLLSGPPAAAPGPGETTVSALALELEQTGRRHLYNMDLTRASELFQELEELSPTSPAAPYYQATLIWMNELTRRGGMGGATFRTSSFWSKKRQAPMDETLDRRFKELVAEAVARADALLTRDPDDIEGLFFRGAAEGVSSAYLASIEHSYYGAYRAGQSAREYHERILALNPGYADACLLPGVFEYTVATLPRSLRVLGFLFGVRGSKEKSVELVRRAVDGGERTRWAAMLSLAVIEQREKRYGSALRVLRELERTFPGNPFLSLEQGSVHMLRKDYRSARLQFERVARAGADVNMDLVEPSFVRLKLAESLLFAKRYDESARELRTAFEMANVPAWVKAPMFLRRGNASDARGHRKAAEADYRRALALDADDVVNRLADRYLDRPFQ